MNHLIALFLAFSVAAAAKSCDKKEATACYKGRLEVKGICANYTIKVLEGKDLDWTEASWTDEQTGKQYTRVFRLANPCKFPDTIKEGEEFYFTIDTGKMEPCTTCMAFYPTPKKAASIRVQKESCP